MDLIIYQVSGWQEGINHPSEAWAAHYTWYDHCLISLVLCPNTLLKHNLVKVLQRVATRTHAVISAKGHGLNAV